MSNSLMTATELYEILKPHMDFPPRLIAFTLDARIDAPVVLTCECWAEYSGDSSITQKVTTQYHIVEVVDDNHAAEASTVVPAD